MDVTYNLIEMQAMFNAAGTYGAVQKSESEKGGEWWAERAGRDADVVQFFRKLCKIATKLGPGDYYMGPKNLADGEAAKWKKTLTLSEVDRDAITWLGLSAMDPRSPYKATTGNVADVWIPILEKVKRLQYVERQLKVTDRERVAIPDDKPVIEEPKGNKAKAVKG